MWGLPPPNLTHTNEQGASPPAQPVPAAQPPLCRAVLGKSGQPGCSAAKGSLCWGSPVLGPPSPPPAAGIPIPCEGGACWGNKDADTEMRPPSLAEERPSRLILGGGLFYELYCSSRAGKTGASWWGRAGPGKPSAFLVGCSVVCCVLCAMQPSAQQRELLHHLLHSPLVHTLSANTEGGDRCEAGGRDSSVGYSCCSTALGTPT